MRLLGLIEYVLLRARKKLNPYVASRLLSRHDFSNSRTRKILRESGLKVGEGLSVRAPLLLEDGLKISLGDQVWINYGLTGVGAGQIEIGDRVLIGPHVTLVTANHPLDPLERANSHRVEHGKITIGANAWIGANVTVCPGVCIGRNSVIGAGSVVTRNIPENMFAAGVPCKAIRSLEPTKEST